jgi:hypothetical protein
VDRKPTETPVLCPVVNDAPNPTPAGWFPDPLGRHEHRYFNGQSWTADVADGGQRRVDPLGTMPGPGPGGAPQQFGAASGNTSGGGSTAALVCGIIAVLLAWIPFLVVGGLVLAILALVFGIRGIRRSTAGAPGRGKAIAGTVLGAIGLGLSIIGVWLSVVTLIEVTDFIEPEAHTAQVTECIVDRSVVTVEGTLTNRSSKAAEFTVFVDIRLQSGESTTSRDDRTVVPVVIDAIGPDETTEWQAVTTNRVGATTCTAVSDVFGPFPFGLEMERP